VWFDGGKIKYFSANAVHTVSEEGSVPISAGSGLISSSSGGNMTISIAGNGIDSTMLAVGSVTSGAIKDGTITSNDVDSISISKIAVSGDFGMAGYKVTNVGAPVNGADVATKAYVDSIAYTWDGSAVNNAIAARDALGLGPLATKISVDSTEIANGSITNAHISSSAAIDQSKIVGLGTALNDKLSKSGGTMDGDINMHERDLLAARRVQLSESTRSCDHDGALFRNDGNVYVCLEGFPVIVARRPVMRIFATSEKYNGDLGGLVGADAKCRKHAREGNLEEWWNYKALLSTSTKPAKDRVTQNKDLYDVVFADSDMLFSANKMWTSSPSSSVYGDEFGNRIEDENNEREVWTGTTSAGESSEYHCGNWTSSSGDGTWGNSKLKESSGWIAAGTSSCNEQYRIYCISQ
jgi:hypothetical protein